MSVQGIRRLHMGCGESLSAITRTVKSEKRVAASRQSKEKHRACHEQKGKRR
jgi:hypothetical protein